MPRALALLLPSLCFAIAWSLQTWVDHTLRISDGDVHTGGLPRAWWLRLHVLSAAVAVGVGWIALHRWRPRGRVAILAGQLVVGFPLYVLACLTYGIAAGIDDL